MSIESQKDVADKVLKMLFPIDPFAIVAGGAPRDWYFGKEAMDIDVFFYSTVPQSGIIEDMLRSVGFELQSIQSAEGLPEWYKLNPHLRCVFNTRIDDVPVQIMLMNEPTFDSVIPKFPFSICKAWYTTRRSLLDVVLRGSPGVKLDKDFKLAEKHKIIVKTNNIYSDEHKYVQKIKSKFPEYKFFDNWDAAKDYVFKHGEIQ